LAAHPFAAFGRSVAKGGKMGIGISLLLIAAGAVLIWAVDVTVQGVDLVTVGWILLVIGGIGALASLIIMGTASSRDGRAIEP
jgi:hypothetical protein